MPLYRKYKQGDLTVAVWKVDETVEQLRSMFHQFSIYEAGYARFSAEKRKQEWLAVRVLLKEILGEEKLLKMSEDEFVEYISKLSYRAGERW